MLTQLEDGVVCFVMLTSFEKEVQGVFWLVISEGYW
jgi:hypothetical protein